MDNPIRKATVKATGEFVNVYRLRDLKDDKPQYYDADAISESKKPTAVRANKKQFAYDELEFV